MEILLNGSRLAQFMKKVYISLWKGLVGGTQCRTKKEHDFITPSRLPLYSFAAFQMDFKFHNLNFLRKSTTNSFRLEIFLSSLAIIVKYFCINHYSSFPVNRSFWHRCQNCIREKKFSKNLTSNRSWTLDPRLLTSCLSCLTPVLDPIAWKTETLMILM